jgi:TatD DNase family protein
MYYDSHSHLDLMDEKELELAIKSAGEKGIKEIISCATNFPSNQKNLELAKKNPMLKPAIGLYPLDAVEFTETELDKAFYFFKAEAQNAIAIGEVGLDFKYCTKEEEQKKQENILSRFIALSNETNKPLIIHSRFAQRQALELLKKEGAKKALLHSFVDSEKLMNAAVKEGYFVSVGVSVLYNESAQKNILNFPVERLLFETDSPIRFNGEKANPSKIIEVAKKVAEIKSIDLEKLASQQEKNYKKLFYS